MLCFLIFYLIGIIIHVIYVYIYTVDDNKYNGQLIRCEKIREIYNNDKIPTWIRLVSRLICKVRIEYYRKNIFSDPNLITSEIKRLIYKRYAKKIIKRKELPEEIINESELSSYFFAYCVYYIQIHGKDKKLEKLRDITGLSMSLSLVFLSLTLGAIVVMIISLVDNIFNKKILFEIIVIFANAGFSILFDCYAEKALKNRVRMTLALYEVEYDNNSLEKYQIQSEKKSSSVKDKPM